jgi:hypothetical protein
MPISKRATTASSGSSLGLARAICAICNVAAIARKCSVDRTTVKAEVVSNLLDRDALFFEGAQYIPIMRGELSIFHRVDSLLGGSENTLVS